MIVKITRDIQYSTFKLKKGQKIEVNNHGEHEYWYDGKLGKAYINKDDAKVVKTRKKFKVKLITDVFLDFKVFKSGSIFTVKNALSDYYEVVSDDYKGSFLEKSNCKVEG